MRNKIVMAALAAAFAALIAMAGCSSSAPVSSASASASSAASEEAAPQTDLTVGAESDSAKSIVVGNNLGKTITNIAFVAAGSEAEPEFLMADGEEWADGAIALINYHPSEEGVYDIIVKCGDEQYTLHGFATEGAEGAAINLEGDIAYLTFEKDGNVISSLADETARAEEAAAAAEAAAEAAAAEAAAAEEVYYEEPTYVEPAPTYNGPAQTQDSCVEGGVVLR